MNLYNVCFEEPAHDFSSSFFRRTSAFLTFVFLPINFHAIITVRKLFLSNVKNSGLKFWPEILEPFGAMRSVTAAGRLFSVSEITSVLVGVVAGAKTFGLSIIWVVLEVVKSPGKTSSPLQLSLKFTNNQRL